ncbi:hypothetical protein HZA33_04800 [Candidatus Pacearchaeota archaeon]|nr:hypothetical protein [Candidatus Pacearchaeota archaeon]
MKKRNKKGQLMHMPFAMIFSIILIIAFVVTAFYVIKYFLDTSSCGSTCSFYADFQTDVESVWNSEGASKVFTESLPSKIEYLCFINYSMPKNLNGLNSVERQIATEIYDELDMYKTKRANVFVYQSKKTCQECRYSFIRYISIDTNPRCYKNTGKVSVRLEKSSEEAFVRVI